MIKLEELREVGIPGYRINEAQLGGPITFELLGKKLEEKNDELFGLPIEISSSQVKSGGFFNSSVEECLIITNTDHPTDYFKNCITMRRLGKSVMISLNYFGTSKLSYKMAVAEERRKSGSITGMLVNAVAGPNKAAAQAEGDYYGMIEELFEELGK